MLHGEKVVIQAGLMSGTPDGQGTEAEIWSVDYLLRRVSVARGTMASW